MTGSRTPARRPGGRGRYQGGMGLEEGHPALDHPAGFLNHHVVCDPVKSACHLSVPRKAEQHRGKSTEDLRQTLILTPHRYLCSSGQVEPTLRLLRIKEITLSTSKGLCKGWKAETWLKSINTCKLLLWLNKILTPWSRNWSPRSSLPLDHQLSLKRTESLLLRLQKLGKLFLTVPSYPNPTGPSRLHTKY